MKIGFSDADEAFRQDVRAFIEDHHPEHLRDIASWDGLTKEDFLAWHRIVGAKGWAAPAWPTEYGGTDWTATQRYIWTEENARADAILPLAFGVGMVGPVIYTYGSEAQKSQHLPGILSGDIWWCQGYSEPGSGSDLASLKTTAVRDGDHYVINGQKTWTTYGHFADWGFFLCRTDPEAKKPQEGISFILVDMKTPGIEVRPIITIDGGHEVNETWLTDVRVPVENLVGKENEGWTYAKFLLAHERTGIAGVATSKRAIERLKRLARLPNGAPSLSDDPDFARKVSQVEMDLTALEYTELRSLSAAENGKGPGAESSMLKIKGVDVQLRITELALEVAGTLGTPRLGTPLPGTNHSEEHLSAFEETAPVYLNMRKMPILGGSNEIQRNIIAKMVLGL